MQAQAKSKAYGITGVPTLIVNGKYRVTGTMAGSTEAMLDVVNFLVQQESASL
jgi:thiol:disulfide interchange protein DsbA